IQLGSIFAVMWLYREKIIRVVTGLPSDAEARHFAVMVIVATIPALVAGALLSEFVKRVLYASVLVIAAAFVIGGIVILIVERLRPHPDVVDADRMPIGRAFVVAFVSSALVVRPFLHYVRNHGFAPFAWYRIAAGLALVAAVAAGWM